MFHIWNGIRTRVARVKGASPRPLDDPDFLSLPQQRRRNLAYVSLLGKTNFEKLCFFFAFLFLIRRNPPCAACTGRVKFTIEPQA